MKRDWVYPTPDMVAAVQAAVAPVHRMFPTTNALLTRDGEYVWWHNGEWMVRSAQDSRAYFAHEYEELPPLEDDMVWTGNGFVKEADLPEEAAK